MSENCPICNQYIECDEDGNVIDLPDCNNTECPNIPLDVFHEEQPLNFHKFETPQVPRREDDTEEY